MAAPPPPPPHQGGPSVDHKREPCPDRILDDVGGAFGMGAVGGGIWHALKGAKNSPGGARLRGSFEVRARRGGEERGREARVEFFFFFFFFLPSLDRRPARRKSGLSITSFPSFLSLSPSFCCIRFSVGSREASLQHRAELKKMQRREATAPRAQAKKPVDDDDTNRRQNLGAAGRCRCLAPSSKP